MKQEKISVLVAKKIREADDVFSYYFVDQAGGSLPAFTAGSHIDVHVDAHTVRQYSLCNSPAEQHQYQIAVLREENSRGGSWKMHDLVKEGDLLEISPPRNHFSLMAGNHPSLLLAGGIGVTPILCMAERLSNSGGRFELHYFARARSRAAFAQRIAESCFASQSFFHFDDEREAGSTDLGAILRKQAPGTHLYVCGPAGFIEAALQAATALGWADERLHREFFKAAAPASLPTDRTSPGFFIRIASSGQQYSVPADRSIVEVLAEHGIDVPISCEQGVCGICLTRVLEGQPDHRDMFLTDEEHARNDQFTPCCSRSKSDVLVLDL